mmetsp:Transcript_26947/g.86603  ORF Transcript_26947/g.86603 Transcript_26947/m.86603 type:complete len:147 (+) Transcript_26947:126-566(+)
MIQAEKHESGNAMKTLLVVTAAFGGAMVGTLAINTMAPPAALKEVHPAAKMQTFRKVEAEKMKTWLSTTTLSAEDQEKVVKAAEAAYPKEKQWMFPLDYSFCDTYKLTMLPGQVDDFLGMSFPIKNALCESKACRLEARGSDKPSR